MSSSTGNLQRSKTIRQISRPSQASQHPGPFHRGDAESFRLCDEGGELLAAKREILRLEGILEAKQREEELQSESDRKRVRRAPPEDVMENNKDFMLLHGKQMQAYVAWRGERERRLKFAKAQAQKVFVVPAPGYYNAWNNEIASWLTTNLRQKRKHRQKQLWIQGPPGIGKTKMMKKLRKLYS